MFSHAYTSCDIDDHKQLLHKNKILISEIKLLKSELKN